MVIKLIGIKGTIKVNYFDVTLISSVSFQKTNVFKITNLSTSEKKNMTRQLTITLSLPNQPARWEKQFCLTPIHHGTDQSFGSLRSLYGPARNLFLNYATSPLVNNYLLLFFHNERIPAVINVLKVNNGNNRKMYKICSKFKFEQFLHIVLVFPLLTLNK